MTNNIQKSKVQNCKPGECLIVSFGQVIGRIHSRVQSCHTSIIRIRFHAGTSSMTTSLFDLTGRVALVTGGSKGWARPWPAALPRRGRRRYLQPARGRAKSAAAEIARERPRSSVLARHDQREQDVQRLAETARRPDGPRRHPGQQCRQQHAAADRRDHRRRLGPDRRAEPDTAWR